MKTLSQYAPVLIPTLNRYEHLKQCLESLSKCSLAEHTEVYIALDFPPSEKYEVGYKKNKEYLYSIGDMNFKKIHIIERETNYGTWNKGDKGNAKYLIMEISQKYDRYIFTEDDNVFSPCFLEFMNKGLELFKDDESVFAISGYRWWFPIKYDTNTFFRQNVDYTPWGVGKWVRTKSKTIDEKWFKKQLSLKNILKLFLKGEFFVLGSLFEFACKEHKDDVLIDQHMRVIMALQNKHMIIPTSQLVKNIGLDGTGTMPKNNEKLDNLYYSIPLSEDLHFEYIGDGYEYYKENHKIYQEGKEWRGQWFYFKRFINKIVKYIMNK